MKKLGYQTLELIESRGDYVVLLNSDGVILHSNQQWVDYCNYHQVLDNYWKVDANYLDELEKNKRFDEAKHIRHILSGFSKEITQLTTLQTVETSKHFSVQYRQFPLGNESFGIIIYKQDLKYLPVNAVNVELVLESMTDAFYLLDAKMNFYYLNSKSKSILKLQNDEMIGRNIWSVFPELLETNFYINYNRAMQERIPLQFEEYYAPLDSWFSVRVKPVNWGGLAVYYQKINEELSQRVEPEYTYKDLLTGWANRRCFEEKVEQILQKGTPFSLLYINLDNFKHVNTLFSHKIGDKVILKLTENLGKLLIPGDIAARLDGDELVILRLQQEYENIEEFLEKIRDVFSNPIFIERTKSILVNASVGVSSYPEDSSGYEELLAFSETAMLEAKKQTGPSYSIFESTMGTDLSRRLMIEKSLEGDLNALGFHFSVQPQINCLNGQLNGVEVLSRWNHPILGWISPFEFISIAEETGTISRLTTHLLKNVFSFINTNKNLYNEFPRTAINVTPSLLSSRTFFKEMFLLMERYSISPESIELEITESVELAYSEMTLKNLMTCRSKGMSIALDDFGTGFSMLAYLMDFPIDKIKLDKSFITKIGHNQKSEAVLSSLIQFVKSIDCHLVAEGVEIDSEAEFLEENGCLIHQGYLYDRPLSPEVFVEHYLIGYNEITRIG